MKFLASIRFALILIFLSALSVILGTILEAKTDSHLLAETWIYHHPLFQVLLCGYFLNILLSALSRRPFKKRHIPFLITHLGLLMIISGVFIKSIFGVQGHLQLIEGTVSDDLIYPQQQAVFFERKFPKAKQSVLLKSIPLNAYFPHAQEKFTSWIHDDHIHLLGSPPLPIVESPHLVTTPFDEHLQIHVSKTDVKPPFLLIEKNDGTISLETETLQGEPFKLTFSTQKLDEWIAYDKGFQGYTLQAKIPFVTELDKTHYESLFDQHLEKELASRMNDRLSEPLELMFEGAKKKILDFPKSVIYYLKTWDQEGSWLFDTPYPAVIDWNLIPKNTYKALYWISELFDENRFIEHLREKKWPLLDSLLFIENDFERYEAWMKQMFSVQDLLPEPPNPLPFSSRARMLSAYLRLFSIHYSYIPKLEIPFPLRHITLESPLFHSIEPKTPPLKMENATPGIFFTFGGEEISLIYDPNRTSLKWPTKDGNYLLRFQPHREKIPYLVRLHQALDIKHPGSTQTASYECTLTLTEKKSGNAIPCTLQMNQVFETSDGYRFYLAGMGTIDSNGVKSIQLIVNRDPAKMMLTYPGALLVTLGIMLLFFGKKSVH